MGRWPVRRVTFLSRRDKDTPSRGSDADVIARHLWDELQTGDVIARSQTFLSCVQNSADVRSLMCLELFSDLNIYFIGRNRPITVAFPAVRGDLEWAGCKAMTVMNGRPSTTEAFPSDGCSVGLFLFVCLVGRAVAVQGRRGADQYKVPPVTL